jgi:hypothetical protein
MKKLWLQYLSYAGLLVISLALQAFQPEMFAMFCTQFPVGGLGSPANRLELPLNSPVVPPERIK